ncbi:MULTISPECIES: MAPEG family protein [Rhizobium]|uniref:MAPEG family protein n=1 Tax=Rhizobium TaxID=379 RepID=UPI0007EA95F4|nr:MULTISPECIES: MAPEG family protein [Rhizobium]ANK90334.1 MAPEG domain-containing protein [Rhizobium sp. N6212]ANK96362.1 MAPEG domain-containing protein [Rhizobium sp. N621]ANL02406.1 MAPEG domain-containing protein [Rhizobium esperanzae]ANL08534.1 MAPEG domain-containing protein [Rhizobium sp. N1341]ANL20582.1 MAPEG domain-containing protein [Rhizobium sp. N113]
MTGYQIFWPLLAHVALVYGLYALLGMRRAKMVRAGKIEQLDYRENRDEPAESLVVKNCLANQFELPVLFYACCVLLYVTEADNLVSVGLAWVFVALRYAHAAVHVTSNDLRYRSPIFAAGYLVLAAMWGWLAIWMAVG